MEKRCAVLTLLILTLELIAAARFQTKQQPPIVIVAGMGSICSDHVYTMLRTTLIEHLQVHVECYSTEIWTSATFQTQECCNWLNHHPEYKDEPEIDVIGVS